MQLCVFQVASGKRPPGSRQLELCAEISSLVNWSSSDFRVGDRYINPR